MVHLLKKVFSCGVRMLCEDGAGMFCHVDFARLARPAAHIAISQQRKSPELIASPRVLQVGQQIVKAQLEAKGCSHVATQHMTRF
jgi:hypothetical protein